MKNAIALGTFDGLHKGHLTVLTLPDNYNKIALTFKKPPKAYLDGNTRCLMSLEDIKSALESMGIRVVLLDFERVADVSAEDFLCGIKEKLNPGYISCGFNYRFGKGGKGDTALLEEFCRENNILLKIHDSVNEDGQTVSSSIIRGYLANGEIPKANRLLSKPFSFKAEVIHGDGRGKTLGFPTLNQRYPENLTPLKFGVYKTIITVCGKDYNGITDIGNRPTYPVDYTICESLIKDFSGDLYGKNIQITPTEFLREEIKFNSKEELIEQIKKDIQ